ncbi:MAG: hypothetical protein HKO53_09915 [Gemmatimonadetes bacterium]|nr:hypothetical protein [Gemmatimonadota bacterium]
MTDQSENPRVDWSIGPRWGFSFPNGLDSNLNGRWQSSVGQAANSENISRSLNVALTLSKKFDAQGRLGFLRFGRQGTGSTIDMDVSMSYDRRRRFTQDKGGGNERQNQGNQTVSVEPNFSYQFSRNLRAGLRVSFSRTTDLSQDNAVTTAVSLGLNATLTF